MFLTTDFPHIETKARYGKSCGLSIKMRGNTNCDKATKNPV